MFFIKCYHGAMNTDVTINRITIEDLEKIIDLGEMLQSEEQLYETNLVFNRKASFEHYQTELTNPDALIIAAKVEDGTIIGYQYSHTHTLEYLNSDNKECVFEALYVTRHFRGKGIGKALNNYAEHWAINEKQVNRISTHIYATNDASLKLHTSSGFKPYNIELVKNI